MIEKNADNLKKLLADRATREDAGFAMSDEQALLVVSDSELLQVYLERWRSRTSDLLEASQGLNITASPKLAPPGYYQTQAGERWWDGEKWGALKQGLSAPETGANGVPGFVLGLLALFFVAVPIFALPLGIPGWVVSRKAQKRIPFGGRGRWAATTGLTLSIIAVSLTSLFMLLAIPGAWVANFG